MRRSPTSLLCAGALLLGAVACSDDDTSTSDEPTTTASVEAAGTLLAKGDDIELVGSGGLSDQTLTIDATEVDGQPTGEFRISEVVVRVDCASTDTVGVVVLAGEVTTGAPGAVEVGDLLALSIREGDPDSVQLHGNDTEAAYCSGLLDAVAESDLADEAEFVAVEAGDDIETA